MPTYDYKCRECEHTFAVFHSMSEPARKECPECGKPALFRLIGAGAGIIFKGSGFYETDYKRKAKPDSSKPATGKPAAETCGEKSCPQAKECPAAGAKSE